MTNPTTPGEFEEAVLAWQDKYLVRINKPNSAHAALDELIAAHRRELVAELQALEDSTAE